MSSNFKQGGLTLALVPAAAVASGAGCLFGAGLFGVAVGAVALGASGQFVTEGVVEIAKTSALAIAAGDRVFWVPGTSAVDKTAPGQVCIGIAVAAAANPSATVTVKLGRYLPAGI